MFFRNLEKLGLKPRRLLSKVVVESCDADISLFMGIFRDIFIMSKGHGCMAQYVILESLGILPTEDLAKYCTATGILGCHPDRGNPGIVASTGSLGHGMGLASGMAYAERILGSDRRVFTVLSDGELQEGSTWEAMMMAAPAIVAICGTSNSFATWPRAL